MPKRVDKLGGASKRLCEMIVQSFAKKIEEGRARDIPDMHTDSGTFLTGSDECKTGIDYTVVPVENPRTEYAARLHTQYYQFERNRKSGHCNVGE